MSKQTPAMRQADRLNGPTAQGFAPIEDARARVLILGSFPSQASLSAGHYYAHPRNQFWRLLSAALGTDLTLLGWPERYQCLRDRGVALWDVVAACERPGSLDADIRRASANDLTALIERLPQLRSIVFNGLTAGRHARRFRDAGFSVQVLPSSSPAHAALSFERKRDQWMAALADEVTSNLKAPRAALPVRHRHRSVDVPITLSEMDGVRYLHFGSPWVQGAMMPSHPTVLLLDYVQRMMAWLLFLSPPPAVLQLGLGAGSLTRFVHARFPESHITVVECSRDVIEVARACFALPPDNERLRVVCDDAGAFMARPRQAGRYGVVQVDLYDQHAQGPVLDSEAFYRDCRRAMAPPGICVVNLFGRHQSFAPNIARLSAAFEARVLILPANSAGNQIVLGFAGPAVQITWQALERRAMFLERRYGWPAQQWYALLRGRSKRSFFEI